ncbi:amidohydrolase [Pseudoruegeria sp. SHC-113]|uniref:amidohydrolase n=1 Tax=Pseudoruegeria sp. SHC-113 TaxID=2855439 RepID=UPI0021BA445F|nr:amidohydrolase [Pseudoruegeria sp. SHC-113]MCT8159309.1 amidohydrolase [Pseudoruegeria sp. SHC-113]
MKPIDRRMLLRAALLGATSLSGVARAFAQEGSLSDIGTSLQPADRATVYTAREIVTLDPDRPTAQAVAVIGGRILGAGSLDEVTAALGTQPFDIDTTFEDLVILPGFIAQHDHPVLAGLTMSSEILAIEDWALPTGTVRAVTDKDDFLTRLTQAHDAMDDPDEPLLTWGYHAAFYGPLTRADLDTVSTTRPIFAWARSCHEFILNTAAMEAGGVTEALMQSWSDSAQSQSSFEDGHFWEQGLFAVLPSIASLVIRPEKFVAGLHTMRDYMHAKGITHGNEPGGILAKPVQDIVNSVMSSSDMPFRWDFIADGKSLVAKSEDDAEVIAETEALHDWYDGFTALAEGSIKLFADGAIYSLAMQVREPYLDGHEGDWMMDADLFERAFRLYWEAGYQIHIHVNGDAGLDRVLENLEANQRRTPRFDHRTVIVHFGVSAEDQVAWIRALGAIVSANPYYVRALADQYSKVGLGPERADSMVRLGDVGRAGVSFSLHSDMPMAPCDPLFLMWCAVNRVTSSGRIAGPEQRVTAEMALKSVTLDAAFSHRLDHALGSIETGKRANFTVVSENPLTVEPMAIKDIEVWGTVLEGRLLQVGSLPQRDAGLLPEDKDGSFALAAAAHALSVVHAHG